MFEDVDMQMAEGNEQSHPCRRLGFQRDGTARWSSCCLDDSHRLFITFLPNTGCPPAWGLSLRLSAGSPAQRERQKPWRSRSHLVERLVASQAPPPWPSISPDSAGFGHVGKQDSRPAFARELFASRRQRGTDTPTGIQAAKNI